MGQENCELTTNLLRTLLGYLTVDLVGRMIAIHNQASAWTMSLIFRYVRGAEVADYRVAFKGKTMFSHNIFSLET